MLFFIKSFFGYESYCPGLKILKERTDLIVAPRLANKIKSAFVLNVP